MSIFVFVFNHVLSVSLGDRYSMWKTLVIIRGSERCYSSQVAFYFGFWQALKLGTLIWKYLIFGLSPFENFSISGSSWLRAPNGSLSCLRELLLFGRSWIQLPCLQHHEFVEGSAKFLSLLATTFRIDNYLKNQTQKWGSSVRAFLLRNLGSAIPHGLDGSPVLPKWLFIFILILHSFSQQELVWTKLIYYW